MERAGVRAQEVTLQWHRTLAPPSEVEQLTDHPADVAVGSGLLVALGGL